MQLTLILFLLCVSRLHSFVVNYEEIPLEYKLLISEEVFSSVQMADTDNAVVERIYREFDRPQPLENLTSLLHPVAPIFEDKLLGFVEKIGFQFDILKVKHPRDETALDDFEKLLSSMLVGEAIDFFSFTPSMDITTFQEASTKYGPLSHVKREEMNDQIDKLLPAVAKSINNLTEEFRVILEHLEDHMLGFQLEIISHLRNISTRDYSKVEKVVREHVYELIPDTLETVRHVLPYAMINAMSELRYNEMEEIWELHAKIHKHPPVNKLSSVSNLSSFDVDFLSWTSRKLLNNSLGALIAHKKFALVRDLTNFGTNYTENVDEVIVETKFFEKMDSTHNELHKVLNEKLKYLIVCALGSVPRLEHRYVRRIVAHYIGGEELLTKIPELKESAPYLTGKVLYGADRVNLAVRRYCYNNAKTCDDLNSTAIYVKNYYVRGMLRIFDLLPEEEILSIKQVQTDLKVEKYKTVMISLYAHCPTLFHAIEEVHMNIENKLGAMFEVGTQEFTRKLEADTLRVLLLISIGRNLDVEDYREYAHSWKRGFTSLKPQSRVEFARSMPDFVKSLTT